jgi:hypothetical protein
VSVPDDEDAPQSSDPALAELLERAAAVRQASEDLVRQSKDLASQIAEAKVIAADAEARRRTNRCARLRSPSHE